MENINNVYTKLARIVFDVYVEIEDTKFQNPAEEELLKHIISTPALHRKIFSYKAFQELYFDIESELKDYYHDDISHEDLLYEVVDELPEKHQEFFFEMDAANLRYESLDEVYKAINIHITPPRISDEEGIIELPLKANKYVSNILQAGIWYIIAKQKDGALLIMHFGLRDEVIYDPWTKKDDGSPDIPDNMSTRIDQAIKTAYERNIYIKKARIFHHYQSQLVQELAKKLTLAHFSENYPEISLEIH